MDILYLLVSLAILLLLLIIWGFFWAVRNNQFDDLEGPAHRILMENDDEPPDEPQQRNE